MANTLTKKEIFTAIADLEAIKENPAFANAIAKEIASLEKKAASASKASAEKQARYSAIKDSIISEMEVGRQYRVNELARELPCLVSDPTMNTSTVTYIMTCLVREMKVKNEKAKGISLYSLV